MQRTRGDDTPLWRLNIGKLNFYILHMLLKSNTLNSSILIMRQEILDSITREGYHVFNVFFKYDLFSGTDQDKYIFKL